MKRKTFRLIAVLVSVIAAGLPMTLVFATKGAAQSPQTQARRAGVRGRSGVAEVPPKWKLGDASSIAIDAQDNVWVLHRPRTLKPDRPRRLRRAIVVFDAAGNFIKAWGGPGSGYDWPEREHGIHIDHKGFVWLGGNNCPASGLPG